MLRRLTPTWIASDEHPDCRAGETRYIIQRSRHALHAVAQTLPDAIQVGLLADVLKARGLTQEAAARQIGCTYSAFSKWVRGINAPTGMYRRALVDWLLCN